MKRHKKEALSRFSKKKQDLLLLHSHSLSQKDFFFHFRIHFRYNHFCYNSNAYIDIYFSQNAVFQIY